MYAFFVSFPLGMAVCGWLSSNLPSETFRFGMCAKTFMVTILQIRWLWSVDKGWLSLKRRLEVNLHCFNCYYSILFQLFKYGRILLEFSYLRTVFRFRRRKQKYLLCVYVLHKISHRCRALKAKEICKKRDVEAKLFFVFLLNLLLLWSSPCCHCFWLRKRPYRQGAEDWTLKNA